MRLQFNCPKCGRVNPYVVKEIPTKNESKIYTLNCGHMIAIKGVKRFGKDEYQKLVFADNRKLFPYQAETCAFAEKANLSCLIAHEMGLGKTIIFQALLKLRAEELLPTMIFCKSGLVRQWFHETLSCLGPTPIQIINSGKEFPIPQAKIFIVSLDMLRSLDSEPWKKIGIKSICIDEVQLIKNHDSKRTNAVRRFVNDTGARIIGLSGTPIKNNPGEYFPILNLLRPELFPTQSNFIHNWCNYDTGFYGTKVNRLISPREFKEFTKDFIIRFERAEVLPDLPKIFRHNRFIDMTKDLMDAYEEVVNEFDSLVSMKEAEGKEASFDNLLAYLAKMRHITGLSKIESAVDFTTEFLLETERKLTIFVHHKDVMNILEARLNSFLIEGGYNKVLKLTSDLDGEQRHEVVQQFKLPENRILLASTLASGEGLNLQFCSDAIMLERQWNPANEEQAEARFSRIGSLAESVNINYITAVGTVDEFLANIIERKRTINRETLTGEEQESWNQSAIIKELTDMILTQKLKSWSMPKGK